MTAISIFFHSSLGDLVEELLRCPRLSGAVAIDRGVGASLGLQEWMAQWSDTPVNVEQRSDTLVRIASSGGTTGPSKGIIQTNETIETQLSCMLAMIPMGPRPVHLAAAPLSHMAGSLCWPTMIFGGDRDLAQGGSRRDSASDFAVRCYSHGVDANDDLHAARPSGCADHRLRLAA